MNVMPVIKSICPPVALNLARRLRPRQTPVAEPEPTGVRTFSCHGLSWRLDMASIVARTMFTTGTWEPKTTRLVLDYTQPGMNVLSVGANFGYYALLMARRVGRSGHVWAFEPTRFWREQLEWHIAENGLAEQITVVPYGLSSAERTVSIEITPQSASMHYWPGYVVTSTETIQLKRLDDVAEELGIADRIDFISMDIDGHEPAFFLGGTATLSRSLPPIALECSQRCLYHAGTDVRTFAAQVRSLGYELCAESTGQPWPSEFAFLQECGNYTSDANVLARPARPTTAPRTNATLPELDRLDAHPSVLETPQ